MNGQQQSMTGIQTNHGLGALLILALTLILLFHFIGFRAIFIAGRPA